MNVVINPSGGDDTPTLTDTPTSDFGNGKPEILRAEIMPGDYNTAPLSTAVESFDARNVRHLYAERATFNNYVVSVRDAVVDGGYVRIDPSATTSSYRGLGVSGSHNRIHGTRITLGSTAMTGVYVSNSDFNQIHEVDVESDSASSVWIQDSQFNELSGGYFKGIDDGITLKAITRDVNHFSVRGATFRQTANVLGIGSEIGYRPTDPGDHLPRYVRNVVAVGIVCDRTSQILNIKPGGIDSATDPDRYNWREGTVENVLVDDVVHSDPDGEVFTRLASFVTAHGGTIRDVTLSGVRARSRCKAHSSAQRLIYVAGGATEADGLTLHNVVLRDIEYTDPTGGASSVVAPGYPIESAIQFVGSHFDVDEFNVDGLRIDGINGNVLRADTAPLGRMRLENVFVRPGAHGAINTYIVKAPYATYTVLKNWEIDIPSVGSLYFNIGGTVVGEEHRAQLGDVPAAGSWKTIAFLVPAQRHVWVVNARVSVSAAVAASVTNYATLTLKNVTRGTTIATLDTKLGWGVDVPVAFSASNLVTNSAMCNRGDVIELQITQSGTGAALSDLALELDYVPF